MAESWKRRRLGPNFVFGVRRRQIRVGRPSEPIVVVRLLEDMKAGDELVMTRRDVRFATLGMEHDVGYEGRARG